MKKILCILLFLSSFSVFAIKDSVARAAFGSSFLVQYVPALLAGLCFGKAFTAEPGMRGRCLALAGASATVSFMAGLPSGAAYSLFKTGALALVTFMSTAPIFAGP